MTITATRGSAATAIRVAGWARSAEIGDAYPAILSCPDGPVAFERTVIGHLSALSAHLEIDGESVNVWTVFDPENASSGRGVREWIQRVLAGA